MQPNTQVSHINQESVDTVASLVEQAHDTTQAVHASVTTDMDILDGPTSKAVNEMQVATKESVKLLGAAAEILRETNTSGSPETMAITASEADDNLKRMTELLKRIDALQQKTAGLEYQIATGEKRIKSMLSSRVYRQVVNALSRTRDCLYYTVSLFNLLRTMVWSRYVWGLRGMVFDVKMKRDVKLKVTWAKREVVSARGKIRRLSKSLEEKRGKLGKIESDLSEIDAHRKKEDESKIAAMKRESETMAREIALDEGYLQIASQEFENSLSRVAELYSLNVGAERGAERSFKDKLRLLNKDSVKLDKKTDKTHYGQVIKGLIEFVQEKNVNSPERQVYDDLMQKALMKFAATEKKWPADLRSSGDFTKRAVILDELSERHSLDQDFIKAQKINLQAESIIYEAKKAQQGKFNAEDFLRDLEGNNEMTDDLRRVIREKFDHVGHAQPHQKESRPTKNQKPKKETVDPVLASGIIDRLKMAYNHIRKAKENEDSWSLKGWVNEYRDLVTDFGKQISAKHDKKLTSEKLSEMMTKIEQYQSLIAELDHPGTNTILEENNMPHPEKLLAERMSYLGGEFARLVASSSTVSGASAPTGHSAPQIPSIEELSERSAAARAAAENAGMPIRGPGAGVGLGN